MALPAHLDHKKGGLVHMAAISFGGDGKPVRIFIPNRWVTDEWLYTAGDTVALLAQFNIVSDQRHTMTNRFLAAMLRLFQPQIAAALHAREQAIVTKREADVFESTEGRSVPVTASFALDLDTYVAALNANAVEALRMVIAQPTKKLYDCGINADQNQDNDPLGCATLNAWATTNAPTTVPVKPR